MPYYMGDFYRGDYYGQGRGDPFWGTVWALGRRAVGAGIQAIRGRPKATVAAAGAAIERVGERAVQTVVQHPVLSAAAAAGVVGIAAGAAGERVMLPGAPGMPLKGYHLTRRQRTPRRPEPHLAKNRRMRATNPRALSRAIRRAHGFARLAKRVLAFTSPRRHKGHMYFKRRRKKA